MTQVEVKVTNKESGEERTMTYKSYLDLTDKFALIGQVDEQGNLIPGDPNLNPRHQKVQTNDVVVPVVNTGMTMDEKLAKRQELLEKYNPVIQEPIAEVKPKKKPGPKPKVTA